MSEIDFKEVDYNDALRAHHLQNGFRELWEQCQFDEMMQQDYPHEIPEGGVYEMDEFYSAVEIVYNRMRDLYETFDAIETKREARLQASMNSVPSGKTGCCF